MKEEVNGNVYMLLEMGAFPSPDLGLKLSHVQQ